MSATEVVMDSAHSRPGSQKNETVLIVSLFIFELSLAVAAIALHMKGERPFRAFLSSSPGMVFVCVLITSLMAGAVIIYRHLEHKRSPIPQFRLIVMMNLITVLLLLLSGEIIVRAGSHSGLDGETFLSVGLKPRSWDQVKDRISNVLQDHPAERSVMIYDDRLGWTLGSSRYSPPKGEGPPYASSVDGLRASAVGVKFNQGEGKTDIALIGDSFTFGYKVNFEETWGYKLEQLLGDDYRVLNFGVPGYGIDQAYLRYMRDAFPKRPKVVIFSFIDDDFLRSMRVYPLVFYPSWRRLPFAKPRFILQDGELREVNHNPAPLETILSTTDISKLPFINYDIGYRQSDWEGGWVHASYLVRLITSRFPSWSAERPEFSDETILAIHKEILKRFIRSAEQAGSIPLIMWFPSERTYQKPASHQPIGKRMLEQAGITYIDPTICLLEVGQADRFVDAHYSPQANTAVASCVYKAVKDALAHLPTASRPLRTANDGAHH